MCKAQSAREAWKIGGVLAVMDEKARAARRAYKREWAQRNPEKIRAYQDKYWARRAERMEAQPEGVERLHPGRPRIETR